MANHGETLKELRKQIRDFYYKNYPNDDEAELNSYIEKIWKYISELEHCTSVKEEVRIIESIYEQQGIGHDYLDLQPLIYSCRNIAYTSIDNEDTMDKMIDFLKLHNVPESEYFFHAGDLNFRYMGLE